MTEANKLENKDANVSATSSKYGRIAAVYEWGAYLGSGGQIQKNKKSHLDYLKSPVSILYPGAGVAIEVAEAAKAGHRVTVVELDEKMLERAKSHLRAQGVLDKVELIHGSVLDHTTQYDVVVANYFLCVFGPDMMHKMFRHLVSLTRADGQLFLSGYAPLQGSVFHRAVQWLNHKYSNVFCSIFVNNAVHPIYDYGPLFEEMGVTEVSHRDFKHFDSFGPVFHRMWAVRRR